MPFSPKFITASKEEQAMERYAAAVEVARGDWPQWRAA
jgi:hypothetical protein